MQTGMGKPAKSLYIAVTGKDIENVGGALL
jgi:hypothetical protein